MRQGRFINTENFKLTHWSPKIFIKESTAAAPKLDPGSHTVHNESP